MTALTPSEGSSGKEIESQDRGEEGECDFLDKRRVQSVVSELQFEAKVKRGVTI